MNRREQILKAAYEIVGSAGIEGLHARTIAASLGINHAAVHYYYRTRYDLLLALIDYAFTRFEEDRKKLLFVAKDPSDRLGALLQQAAAYTKPESRFAKNWASFFVASIADERLRPVLVERLEHWLQGLQNELKEAHVKGVADGESPFLSSEVLAATLIGIIIMAQATGQSFPSEEALERIASSLAA